MDYEKLVEEFKKCDCTLLSTEDEINALMKETTKKSVYHYKLRYIPKCGHEAQGYFTNMKYKDTDILCPECSRKISVERVKDFYKNNKVRSMEIENEGYNYLKNIMEKTFDIVKTNEGCLADFIVRPAHVETDEWLKVQIKTTCMVSTNKLYGFSMVGKTYPHCLIVCVCLADKRTWILDGDTLPILKSKLNIGAGKSKYSQYEVLEETEICKTFTKSYTTKILFPEKECMIPISVQQQQEQMYRQMREKITPFVYVYPEMEGLKYDFKVGELKFQEKVCSIPKPNWYIVGLYTNSGHRGAKRIFKAYKKGDNDFYWLWLKDTQVFYVIPEEKLIEYGKIESKTERPYLSLSTKDNSKWYQDYKFDVDKLDIEKLRKLLNILVS